MEGAPEVLRPRLRAPGTAVTASMQWRPRSFRKLSVCAEDFLNSQTLQVQQFSTFLMPSCLPISHTVSGRHLSSEVSRAVCLENALKQQASGPAAGGFMATKHSSAPQWSVIVSRSVRSAGSQSGTSRDDPSSILTSRPFSPLLRHKLEGFVNNQRSAVPRCQVKPS